MKYEFIGWYRDEANNHDKVWGIILLQDNKQDFSSIDYQFKPNQYVSFWGRRGKKLQTKLFEDSEWSANEMAKKKEQKGYIRIDTTKLNEVYPEFEKDLSKTAFWASFKI